jgi:hypothetical protein
MAGGTPEKILGYRFTAKPLPLWRRLTFDFWPYWQASAPKFVLRVTKLDSSAQSQAIRWFVIFANGDFINRELDISSLQLGKSVDFVIDGTFLGYTGDTSLILPSDLSLSSSKPKHYRTVYAFHVTQKSWLALAFVAAFLAGIFAALGHWLLGLIN